MARTPEIIIEHRGCKPFEKEFKAAGVRCNYIAFAKINTPLGLWLHKEVYIATAETRKEIDLVAEVYLLKDELHQLKDKVCRLKKGIKK